MLKIAITGNIASGKSQVEKFISEKYTVFDADNIAHQILGNVDRKKLGEKVFSDPAARKKLEEFIHPKVKDEILKIFEQNLNVVFISIPLLFETGFDALFDKIIFVQCDDDIRLQRLMRRNDFTEEQALKRMNAQLPQKEKMTDPTYFDITGNMIGSKKTDNAIIHVLAGEYDSIKGVEPPHIKATIYDVELQAGKSITLPTKTEDNVFIFLIEGNAIIDGTNIPEKTAVLFSEGDEISVSAESDKQLRFMFCSAKPLKEPVSWGGPIVMNTREELNEAFKELDKGTFIKHNAAHLD